MTLTRGLEILNSSGVILPQTCCSGEHRVGKTVKVNDSLPWVVLGGKLYTPQVIGMTQHQDSITVNSVLASQGKEGAEVVGGPSAKTGSLNFPLGAKWERTVSPMEGQEQACIWERLQCGV